MKITLKNFKKKNSNENSKEFLTIISIFESFLYPEEVELNLLNVPNKQKNL